MKDGSVRPCPHMGKAVNQLAEGRTGGLYLWYAARHLLRCPRCQAALEALKSYFAQVARIRSTPDIGMGGSRWAEIESQVRSVKDQEPG